MTPTGIGLVGAGAFGIFCLDAFAAMSEVRIVAIADIDEARVKALAPRYGAKAYTSLEDLLENPEVEIVALNTPPHLHASGGLAVLQAGKHLFCEKPLALTLAEGEQLVAEAEKRGLRLSVDYVMRHNPFWQTAARLNQSGVLGQLLHMDLANHAAGLNLAVDHWFWDADQSGGIWIEHGVHFFDAFAWVAGEAGVINGSQSFVRGDGAVDRVEALAQFGQTAAHFYHGFTHSGQTEQTTVTLTFEQGYVVLHEWVPTSIELLTPVEPEALRPFLPPAAIEIQSERVGKQHHLVVTTSADKGEIYRESIQAGMRDLALAISNPQHQLRITGQDALASLRLAVAATNA
ncbi:MAG: Gfo/Idh/MocA family oxidoreductase [Anaerolineae bacterium]|nr:Gfo/Idh/MocA family oxidoreductase [Anaerolineae bacterium]